MRRLERDVSFASRLTYAGQSGRITGVCAVLDGASVASTSSSGSLHVWRVEYTGKPGGWAPDKYRGVSGQGCGHRSGLLQATVLSMGGSDVPLLTLASRPDVACVLLLVSNIDCALIPVLSMICMSTSWRELLPDEQLVVGVMPLLLLHRHHSTSSSVSWRRLHHGHLSMEWAPGAAAVWHTARRGPLH